MVIAALVVFVLLTLTGCGTTVPDVRGLDLEDATSALYGAGFNLGVVTEEADDEVEEGLVVSQSPEAGTEVVGGSPVNLVVSVGSE